MGRKGEEKEMKKMEKGKTETIQNMLRKNTDI